MRLLHLGRPEGIDITDGRGAKTCEPQSQEVTDDASRISTATDPAMD